MPKAPTPSSEELELFAETIRQAGPCGKSATTALHGNRPVGKWVESLQDFLPPELANLGLECRKIHRGYKYFASDAPKAKTPTRVAGQIRARKTATESKDWAWFAAQVNPLEWRQLFNRIAAAPEGKLWVRDAVAPMTGKDIRSAIVFHTKPKYLPPQLASLGVTFEPVVDDRFGFYTITL